MKEQVWNDLQRKILALTAFVFVVALAAGYVSGWRDGARYVQTITDCGKDRACITAAGGDPGILD